jgi:hypothetical protein
MLITETFFTKRSYFTIPNYTIYDTQHPDGTAHEGTNNAYQQWYQTLPSRALHPTSSSYQCYFSAHINRTMEKLITLINMLARTAKLQWGLGHKALKTIYKGAVVPLPTYGAPRWGAAIWKNRNLKKYKRGHRLMNINL